MKKHGQNFSGHLWVAEAKINDGLYKREELHGWRETGSFDDMPKEPKTNFIGEDR